MTTGVPALTADLAIEDIYPLTPMQQGMLFHTLHSERAGPYVEQFVLELTGKVDVARLVAAWKAVVARHPVLRTAFVWEGVDEPHQVVVPEADVPIGEHDLTGRTPAEIEAFVTEFLAVDRAQGLPLAQPPLMRLTLLWVDSGGILLWTVHHLVLDGWSLSIILRDVAAIYRAGEPPYEPASAAPRPFRDFVGWLDRQDLAGAERFWRERLREMPTPVELAVVPGSPSERRGTAAAGLGRHDLDAGLTHALRAVAVAARVTLSTVFQAAWAVMLSRHCGSRTVTYGLTVSGRPSDLAGAEDIVGPFINTVPQRLSVTPGRTLGGWLREIQRQHLDREPFQHASLVDIGRWLGSTAERPLFDTILVFENYPDRSPAYDLGSDTRVVLTDFVEDTSYPMTVVVLPGGSGLRLRLLYDEDRFAPEAVTTLLGRLEAVLAGMAAGVETDVAALDVIGAEERKRLVDDWNRTAVTLPGTPVHAAVADQAARTPDAVAVDDHGRLLTYAELDQRADALAAVLAGRGVGPDVVVAVFQRRSAAALTSVLGVLKAGGAYLALDPGHPDARLAYLLDDARAALVLTEAPLAARVPPGVPVLVVDAELPPAEQSALPVPVDGRHLCYVTYTSGSTGRPKGIGMPHGAVANIIEWQVRHTSVGPQNRTFAFASLSFDVSFQEIFATWSVGGTLILVDDHERADFEGLVQFARDESIERWYLPAFALEQVAATAARQGLCLPALREVVAGSEPLHVTDDLRWLLGQAPASRLENQYGPSECHVVTCHVVTESAADIPDYPSIGRPVANTRVYLLDDVLRPVPVGVAGSVYLAGAGLARGYLGRPATTAERFVPCPYAAHPGERMYDTGDRGRYWPDGSIEFLGRLDNQVKIRGFRVELAEVEAVLRDQPEVREAVVLLATVAGERRLVGYVVPVAGREIDPDAVLDRLHDTLPDYLIPWTLTPLEAFPLTVNRKVDRAALPAPRVPGRPAVPDPTSTTTPSARLMTALWTDVLGVSAVGLDDDFFRLGGHSLTAIRLVGRVRTAFGVTTPVGALFGLRTPRRLLERVASEIGSPEAADDVARRRLADEDAGAEEGTHA